MTNDILNSIDTPCRKLVAAMNRFPGIYTVESCCGHGAQPMRIFFKAESLEVLPDIVYWFSTCHSGVIGWHVIARTDCNASPIMFIAESTSRGEDSYKEADQIAKHMIECLDENQDEIAASKRGVQDGPLD